MTEGSDGKIDNIEVRVKKGANDRTTQMADQMNTLLNSPIFAEMVRKAVEEMCLEGKLVYDMEKDTFMESEDLVKEFAIKEMALLEGPSKKKRSPRSKKGKKGSTKELAK